jgi:hypothetical protein
MSTTTSPITFKVDELVTVFGPKHPGVWRVESVPTGPRGVNYTIALVGNPAKRLRCPGALLARHTGPDTSATVTVTEFVPLPVLGAIVRVEGNRKIRADVLYVVTGFGRDGDTVKLARLGGEGNREWRGVLAAFLREVPAADLPALLPAHLAAVK